MTAELTVKQLTHYLDPNFDFCNRRAVNVLILPETTLPFECLEGISNMLQNLESRLDVLMAGSHLLQYDPPSVQNPPAPRKDKLNPLYKDLGFEPSPILTTQKGRERRKGVGSQ